MKKLYRPTTKKYLQVSISVSMSLCVSAHTSLRRVGGGGAGRGAGGIGLRGFGGGARRGWPLVPHTLGEVDCEIDIYTCLQIFDSTHI